jgi:hypothetical protein
MSTPEKHYRYYDLIMAAFVTILLCSNLIGASKVCTIGGFTFGAGVLFFPISYIFGDVLTEVYGYKRSRKVVWAGFAAMAFASFMAWIVLALPPASGWPHQAAYETVFGGTYRIVAHRLSCGGIRQLLRARSNENLDARPSPLVTRHRLHDFWRRGRFPDFLSDRILGSLAKRISRESDVQ